MKTGRALARAQDVGKWILDAVWTNPCAHRHVDSQPKGYESLRIYQQAHDLGLRVHALCERLPHFESFEEAPQVRGSSKRVSSSIVEGYAHRIYRGGFIVYLVRAVGSSDETIEHLEYLDQTGSARACPEMKRLIDSYVSLSKQIAMFLSSVRRIRRVSAAGEDSESAPHPPSGF